MLGLILHCVAIALTTKCEEFDNKFTVTDEGTVYGVFHISCYTLLFIL